MPRYPKLESDLQFVSAFSKLHCANPISQMNISSFAHKQLNRQGSQSNGCTVAERTSVDFVIDGKSLLESLVDVDGGHADYMGCFVKGYPDQSAKSNAALMLRGQSDSEGGRVLIYICPECGDIGCGAYAVCISESQLGYLWESFAYVNDYEEPREVEGLGPFLFEKEEYEAVVRHAAAI